MDGAFSTFDTFAGSTVLYDSGAPAPVERRVERLPQVSKPLTLRRGYEEYHRQVLLAADASPVSFHGYTAAVRCWERLGFPDLDLRELRQSHLLKLKANMLARGQKAVSFDAIKAKIWAVMNTLVAEELLERMPATPRITKTQSDERDRPTPEQIVRLMQHADAAEWPTTIGAGRRRPLPVSPGQFWRSIYALVFLTALRRTDAWTLNWDSVTPQGIRLTPRKTRRRRKQVFVPNVAGLVTAALRPMRICHTTRVFPMSIKGDRIAEAQRAIAIAAQVPPDLAEFQAFRCASLDAWTYADERAPELIAGHALKMHRTTRSCYVGINTQEDRIKQILNDAAQQFPIPEGFAEAITGGKGAV